MKRVYNNSYVVARSLNFEEIKCVKDDELRTIEDIHEEIYKKCIKILKK